MVCAKNIHLWKHNSIQLRKTNAAPKLLHDFHAKADFAAFFSLAVFVICGSKKKKYCIDTRLVSSPNKEVLKL